MAEIDYIKHLWEREGKSLREIARVTGLSFQTVRKYAHKEDWNAEKEREKAEMPPEKYPALADYIPFIDSWLAEDARQPRKQRHTVTRIYTRLREECGYPGSYSSVKRYTRKKKEALGLLPSAGYLPLAQPPAHAQLDFGEFRYYDGRGKEDTAHALTMTFPYSNMGFSQVFRAENQECLLEGMKRVFEHIGGVPVRVRADNMTTAVSKILMGADRKLTEGFTRFKLHYRFETDFCNPKSGHEKGNVENKVGYSRRNFFVPVPRIEEFERFNEELFSKCEKDGERKHYRHQVPLRERWEEEREKLLTLPERPYEVFRLTSARVDKYGFVCVDKKKYGLSPEFAGQLAEVRLSYDRADLYCGGELLKSYERCYGEEEERSDWKEYLDTLCKKPGAVEHTRFFGELPERWREHLARTTGKERKTALLLLREMVKDGHEDLCETVLELAGLYGRTDGESLKHFYYALANGENRPAPLELKDSVSLGYNPDLSKYDALTGGVSLG